MTSYEIMANAIVVQAVNDWCDAVRTINKIKKPKSQKQKDKLELAKGRKTECESFFLGGWFTLITGVDGDAFMRDLRKEDPSKQPRRKTYGHAIDEGTQKS